MTFKEYAIFSTGLAESDINDFKLGNCYDLIDEYVNQLKTK